MTMIMTGVANTGGRIASLNRSARCSGWTRRLKEPLAPRGIWRMACPVDGPWPLFRWRLRRIAGQAEAPRVQAGMKPGYEAVDVIDRHPQVLPERAGERDHICAL